MTPKLKIAEKLVWADHRSGWGYALGALEPLFSAQGVLFDTFIEANFGWKREQAQREGVVPYREPWVGVVHNPPGIPEWHEYYSAPQNMFTHPMWKESVAQCRGLFTLSQWMAEWLRARTGLPVEALIHPTETPEVRFEWGRFERNPEPKVVQVGWWLRRFRSIYELPVKGLRRAALTPVLTGRAAEYRQAVMRDLAQAGGSLRAEDVLELPRLDDRGFDELLAENVVFVHLYDSVCNNTVVECIVRHTPVLVNPLPSIVEYLGAGYPLYFDTLAEAAGKAEDRGRLKAAHEYLRELPKEPFSAEYFRRSFAGTKLYQSL